MVTSQPTLMQLGISRSVSANMKVLIACWTVFKMERHEGCRGITWPWDKASVEISFGSVKTLGTKKISLRYLLSFSLFSVKELAKKTVKKCGHSDHTSFGPDTGQTPQGGQITLPGPSPPLLSGLY